MRFSAAPISSSKPGCLSLGACTTPSIELNSPAVTLRIGRFLSFVPAVRRVAAPATNGTGAFDTTSENFSRRPPQIARRRDVHKHPLFSGLVYISAFAFRQD